MKTLIISCPSCGEELEITEFQWEEFRLDDILVCDSCAAELQVTSLDPPEFCLIGDVTVCPKCETEFELLEEDLERGKTTCPNCEYQFKLEFDTT
jgi:lysine biosynthesis protein LysW